VATSTHALGTRPGFVSRTMSINLSSAALSYYPAQRRPIKESICAERRGIQWNATDGIQTRTILKSSERHSVRACSEASRSAILTSRSSGPVPSSKFPHVDPNQAGAERVAMRQAGVEEAADPQVPVRLAEALPSHSGAVGPGRASQLRGSP
jgi:hypothetical protein